MMEDFHGNRIALMQGDITRLKTDAIVNAANYSLLGGGGVDGAIHRAAGPELLKECRTLNGCPTGDAKITKGYRLPSKYVIHTVAPVWRGGTSNEEDLLASCYRKSLELANTYNLQSIAFPNIGTGIYRFPKESAASIAISEVLKALNENSGLLQVVFICFDEENFSIYRKLLKAYKGQ